MGRSRVHGWCRCGFHYRRTAHPPSHISRAELGVIARGIATSRVGPGSRLPGPVIQQAITANA